jgi:hypothetical protein
MRETSCPICGSESAKENVLVADSKLGSECECPRCGKFSIVGEAVHAWATGNPTPRQKANASAWIRERRGIWLTADDVPGLLRIASLSIADRADRLLIEISRHFPAAGEEVRLEYNDPAILSCSWSNSSDEVVCRANVMWRIPADDQTTAGALSRSVDDNLRRASQCSSGHAPLTTVG